MSERMLCPERATASVDSREARAEVESLVIEALAEITGYPADLLDVELDLETDLAIEPRATSAALARVLQRLGLGHDAERWACGSPGPGVLRTLRAVIDAIVGSMERGDEPAHARGSRPFGRFVREIVPWPLRVSASARLSLVDKHVVVTVDPYGVASCVAALLDDAGARVTLVYPEDAGHVQPRGALAVDLTRPAAVRALMEQVRVRIAPVDGVFHLHALGPAIPFVEMDRVVWARAVEQATATLAMLEPLRADFAAAPPGQSFVLVATQMGGCLGVAMDAARDGAHDPLAGAYAGAVESLRRALPDTLARIVDLDALDPIDIVARQLVEEVTSMNAQVECGYIAGARHVVTWKKSARQAGARPGVGPGWRVLIAGGARGPGRALARALVTRVGCVVHVIDVSGEAADAGRVRAAMEELCARHGRVDAIVYAAGAPEALPACADERARRMVTTWAHGAFELMQATRGARPRLFLSIGVGEADAAACGARAAAEELLVTMTRVHGRSMAPDARWVALHAPAWGHVEGAGMDEVVDWIVDEISCGGASGEVIAAAADVAEAWARALEREAVAPSRDAGGAAGGCALDPGCAGAALLPGAASLPLSGLVRAEPWPGASARCDGEVVTRPAGGVLDSAHACSEAGRAALDHGVFTEVLGSAHELRDADGVREVRESALLALLAGAATRLCPGYAVMCLEQVQIIEPLPCSDGEQVALAVAARVQARDDARLVVAARVQQPGPGARAHATALVVLEPGGLGEAAGNAHLGDVGASGFERVLAATCDATRGAVGRPRLLGVARLALASGPAPLCWQRAGRELVVSATAAAGPCLVLACDARWLIPVDPAAPEPFAPDGAVRDRVLYPLIERLQRSEGARLELVRTVSLDSEPYLQARGEIPAAVHIETLIQAGRLCRPTGTVVAIEDVDLTAVVRVPAGHDVRLRVIAEACADRVLVRQICDAANAHGRGGEHATGDAPGDARAGVAAAGQVVFGEPLPRSRGTCHAALASWAARGGADVRPWLRERGERAQALRWVQRRGEDEILACVRASAREPRVRCAGAPRFRVDPFLLDACLQAAGVLVTLQTGRAAVPAGVRRLRVYREADTWEPLYAHVMAARMEGEEVACDIEVVDAAGHRVWDVEGARVRATATLARAQAQHLEALLADDSASDIDEGADDIDDGARGAVCAAGERGA